ncbi:TrkH family potassium uptake protein [Priestia koreensis]|uniref:TrkH family potassium uptake protein n=1 Tax=Priestia koreensis TaxID=284581 RepID=UPI0028F6D0BA|nr:TrkH family potassium uptake protein [Priestia koreensis]
MPVVIRSGLKKFSSAQIIVSFYIIAVTVSVILISLPVAHKQGVHLSFMDSLFTAVSAVSVTGLSTISIKDTFSVPGIFILIFVLQFGGIGIMTLSTFIWLLIGKKIGLQERRLIMTDQNQSNLSGLVNLIRNILIIILGIEIIGAVVLGVYFMNYYPTWEEAFLQGFFASVSATTNAGFDITGQSLIPYADDYFVQSVNILLLTLGAIGFPVLIELKQFFFNLKEKRKFHFTLNTKITTSTFGIIFALGTIIIFFLEYQHFFKGKTFLASFFYALFHSATTKSGGLATMDVSDFTPATLLFLCLLMFIGASPSSVGGGIRTTTLALNLLFLYHYARGRKHIRVFKREILDEDVRKSLVVTMMAMVLCFTASLVLMTTEPFSPLEIVFEVCSAFGTTGLSMGITADLSVTGKLVIMVLMFIGRIGILSFLFIISGKTAPPNYHYPKERVIIG